MTEEKSGVDVFRQSVKAAADKPAIIYGGRVFTYKELNERVNQSANALLDLGVKRQDRIPIGIYNSNQFAEAFFSIQKIAAVPCNLNYRYIAKELQYVIDDSDASAVFMHEDLIERIQQIRPDLKKVKAYIVIGKKENVPSDMYHYEELISRYPKTEPKLEWKPAHGEDYFVQGYTTGTTGKPKGCQWTHNFYMTGVLNEALPGSLVPILQQAANYPADTFRAIGDMLPVPGLGSVLSSGITRRLLRTLAQGAMRYQPSIESLITSMLGRYKIGLTSPSVMVLLNAIVPGNIRCLALNQSISNWSLLATFTFLMLGGTIVYLTSKSFDPHEALETIERRKPNILWATGEATLKPMVDLLEKEHYDLSSVVAIVPAGAYVTAETKKKLLKYMPHSIYVDIYTQTEAINMAIQTYSSADKDIYRSSYAAAPDMRVVDENFEPVKPGEIGMVVGKKEAGMSMMSGYYKDAEKTEKLIKEINGEKWWISGDMGYFDEEGMIHMVGRGSECINTGGFKVYPDEVEEILMANPKVDKVSVVSVPDERWGEAVTAAIELKEGEKATEEEIINFCSDKMAGFKKPKHVLFFERDTLPISAGTGKAIPREVRVIAKEMLGIEERGLEAKEVR